MQLWDITGMKRFANIREKLYKNAHGMMLVYDITDRSSFKNLESWLKEIENYGDGTAKIMLIGNKVDL